MTAPLMSSEVPPVVLSAGAGASALVGDLLRERRRVVAVDIAPAALDALARSIDGVAAHLAAGRLRLVAADVCGLEACEPPIGTVDVWHDRAVFHFLVDDVECAAYARGAAAAVRRGGHLVIATFAPAGPTSCSGLPVRRHDAGSLVATFGADFELVESFESDHRTPWSTTQRFTHALFRRT